jgi:hypothetical protein
MYAKSGIIGGWNIASTNLSSNNGAVGISSGIYTSFWAGSTNSFDAPFRVTPAGVLTAKSGTVGGWTIGATSLTTNGGGTGMSSSSYPFWAGNTTPEDAPFRVSIAGALKATGVDISGKITATSGAISGSLLIGNVNGTLITDGTITTGKIATNTIKASNIEANTITGSKIAANTITTTNIATNTITASNIKVGALGGFTITSTNMTGGTGTGAVGIAAGTGTSFWAGGTNSTAPFRVTNTGVLTAQSGTVGGWTLGANSIKSGTGSGVYTAMQSNPSSSTYAFACGSTDADNYSGAPFRVKHDGQLYIDRVWSSVGTATNLIRKYNDGTGLRLQVGSTQQNCPTGIYCPSDSNVWIIKGTGVRLKLGSDTSGYSSIYFTNVASNSPDSDYYGKLYVDNVSGDLYYRNNITNVSTKIS